MRESLSWCGSARTPWSSRARPTDKGASIGAPPLTQTARPSDAHSHLQVVPCSWQRGGPITLASDSELARQLLCRSVRRWLRHQWQSESPAVGSPIRPLPPGHLARRGLAHDPPGSCASEPYGVCRAAFWPEWAHRRAAVPVRERLTGTAQVGTGVATPGVRMPRPEVCPGTGTVPRCAEDVSSIYRLMRHVSLARPGPSHPRSSGTVECLN